MASGMEECLNYSKGLGFESQLDPRRRVGGEGIMISDHSHTIVHTQFKQKNNAMGSKRELQSKVNVILLYSVLHCKPVQFISDCLKHFSLGCCITGPTYSFSSSLLDTHNPGYIYAHLLLLF